jgi:hypothetical protein
MSFEILDYQSTPLGTLILRQRELISRPGTMVTEVTLNHEFLMSSYLTESERALTRIGLELVKQNRLTEHPLPGIQSTDPFVAGVDLANPISVLVGGLGLGYTAAEALKSAEVESVKVIEFLPAVIGWLEAGLIPLAEKLNSDNRLTVACDDVYACVTAPVDGRYDLIAIDVDHSPEDVLGDQSCGFYQVAGLQQAARHLSPSGVLAIWSYAQDTPLLEKMKTVFDQVQVEQVTVWNDLIDEEQTDWLFFGSDCR